MTGKLPEPMELLAAEYVLGLADNAERAKAERLLATDADFAVAVSRWQDRVAPWFDEVGERAHSPDLHAQIMAALPALAPVAANDDLPDGRRSLNLWRSAALLMTAASVVLAAMLTLRAPAEPTDIAGASAPMLLATLALPDAAAISLTVDPASGRVTAMPVGITADGVHDHQLWVIPADGTPRSLGLVDPGAAPRRAAPDMLAALRDGATIAVSYEPAGGSPQPGPSGPVLATAPLREI
jgi:anti-sigma-K factor RskA